MKNYILIIGLLCANFNLFSQSEDDVFLDMSLEDLMNISVVTASKQSESIIETPVPVTVITREMIDAIGARNMKELLTAYVPGMTAIEDHNEMNVSMRGVYASSQQKILFLVNGHRLNSRAYSMANPDYSINLDKVKQIEIVRGPGSSIYGNVALTGVINIITLSGEELDGTQVKISAGNFGQKQASLVAGTSLGEDKDVMFWAGYYSATGEERKIDVSGDYSSNTQGGVAYLGAVQGDYDIGVQTKINKIDLLFNITRGKIQEPFSSGGGTGEVYDKDDYAPILGETPGLGQVSQHFKIGYSTDFSKNFDFKIDLYADNSSVVSNLISAPATKKNLAVFWQDRDFGGISQVTFKYNKGNVLLGVQVDYMEVYDSYFAISTDTTGVLNTFLDKTTPLLEEGNEIIYSSFSQWKHKFSDKFSMNTGVRYDNKERHKGGNVEALSPRLAFLYNISDAQHLKISYSRSFVDAPYWYRYNSLASYSGSQDLQPEILEAVQLTLDSKLMDNKIYNNLNVFYQSLTNFIYRDNDAGVNDPKYRNAGKLNSVGIEEQVNVKLGKFLLIANATLQLATKAVDYSVDGSKIANVPSFLSNIIGVYKVTDNINLTLGAKFLEAQFAPVRGVGTVANIDDNYISSAFVLDGGINYTNLLTEGLSADLRVRNITGAEYYQGGSTRFAYPQQGRWITFSLKYLIK